MFFPVKKRNKKSQAPSKTKRLAIFKDYVSLARLLLFAVSFAFVSAAAKIRLRRALVIQVNFNNVKRT